MPRSYPPEYGRRVIALHRSRTSVVEVTDGLEEATATNYNWWNQHLVDTGGKLG